MQPTHLFRTFLCSYIEAGFLYLLSVFYWGTHERLNLSIVNFSIPIYMICADQPTEAVADGTGHAMAGVHE